MIKRILVFLMLCSVAFGDNPYRILNSFNAGEMSPLLNSREDLAKYQSGCSIMENMIPIPQGGGQKRPGTKYIAEVKTSSLATRLLQFEFSTTQSYIIEAGNQYMRFFTDGIPIVEGVGTEDISSLDNVVAQWRLNEIGGTTAVNANDPGTYDGTVSANILGLTTEGIVDLCFDFDAQYDVTIADDSVFSFTDNSNDTAFSLSCWAFITQQDSIKVLLSKWRNLSTTSEWRLSLTSDRKLQLHLTDSSASLASDRVAQWKMNDSAANTAVDDDVASVPHDGVLSVNTDTIDTAGIIGTCFDFGGTEEIVVPDNIGLSFDDSGSNPFSISSWVFVTDTGNTQTILSKWDSAAATEWRFQMNAGNVLYISLWDESSSKRARVFNNSTLSVGWHHVVMTYDSTGGSTASSGLDLYVDGSLLTDVTKETQTGYIAMENTATKVLIGATYQTDPTTVNNFADKIDNVILFDIELNAAQVSTLYNSGSGIEDLTSSLPTPFAITDNALSEGWHFLNSTYSAPADETAAADGIILYVDGAAVDVTATNDADYTAMQNGTEEIRIGVQRNSGDSANERLWADKIDAVAVFSDVLTPAEIASFYSTKSFEIETPYLTADLFSLKYEQSADVLYITHPDYETQKLSRLSNNLWTISAIGIQDGPFRTQNKDVADFIKSSGTTGTVTLTTTGHNPFVLGSTSGHEPSGSTATSKSQTGALFKLVHPIDELEFKDTLEDDFAANPAEGVSWMSCGTLYKGAMWTWVTGGTWLGTVEVQRNYTLGASASDSGWETVLPFSGITTARNVITDGSEDDGDADYRVIFIDDTSGTVISYFTTDQTEHIGIVKITSVTSSTEAIGTVLTTLASTDKTYKWAEGSWSNFRGWPQTVTFFEDRLTFGGNRAQPDTIWASVTSDYENMTAGPDDDEALIFTLSSRQVNVIEWIIGKDKLLIGTSGAEWTIVGGTDEPLTPSNAIAKQHSTYGSSSLQAGIANDSILFFQRGAEKMRELAYNWELDSYVAPDMTILASHVTDGGIVNSAFQRTPDSILWTIRSDGQLPLFSYERRENVTAWSRMITTDSTGDSDFESVAVINGDPEDEVWVIVKRVINSNTVRYIEQFQPRKFSDAEDAFYIDAGITYDSTASSAMTGLDHLEGETVYVLADGVVFDTAVVSGGALTLKLGGTTTTASTVQMGLAYEVKLRTMPLSWLGGVTIQGKTKRISEVVANWYNSGDFSIGKDASTMQVYSITGQTTNQDRKTFPPGYSRNGYIFVYQKSPEPLTILAVMVEFQVQ